MSIYSDLIKLNLEFEGALRVAEARRSPEAIELAKEKLAVISYLFTKLKDEFNDSPLAESASSHEESVTLVEDSDTIIVETTGMEAESDDKAESHSVDILKAFTLNDKFLFRRELFDGDDREFNDTLNLIAAMNSIEEVEEYLFYDMQWDCNREEVKDFIGIVSSYLQNR